MNLFEPRALAFLCQWCSYRGADAAGRQRRSVPWQLHPIRVPCAGRVSPEHLLRALRSGADGVLVLACHPGDCHYGNGNARANHRVDLLRRVLDQAGIGAGRVCFDHVAAGEGERYARATAGFVEELRALGPLRMARPGPALGDDAG